jgi:dihydrofolate reductase
MAKLIYSAIMSLDGYIADEQGEFDWAAPDDEVHAFVNELTKPIGTYLHGRKTYELMIYWETADAEPGQNPVAKDFALIWQAANKIVYSRTLETVSTARTTLERELDLGALRQLKESSEQPLAIGGPSLAQSAIKAGLVDEFELFVNPVVIGGGTQALPDGARLDLKLLDEHRFGNGVVYLRYGKA